MALKIVLKLGGPELASNNGIQKHRLKKAPINAVQKGRIKSGSKD